jgi:hypothetical protein
VTGSPGALAPYQPVRAFEKMITFSRKMVADNGYRWARPTAGARDGIAAEISTRTGLVTVVFTGREHARACPAAGVFTDRGRQYAGSMLLTGPGWRRSPAASGLSLHPAGGPAGRGTADTIAGIIGADVAAYLRDHREILDLAAQTRARADRARAQRDLDFLAAEIVAAEYHLDELRRKKKRLRAIAGGLPEDTSEEQLPRPAQAGWSGAGDADDDLIAGR